MQTGACKMVRYSSFIFLSENGTICQWENVIIVREENSHLSKARNTLTKMNDLSNTYRLLWKLYESCQI